MVEKAPGVRRPHPVGAVLEPRALNELFPNWKELVRHSILRLRETGSFLPEQQARDQVAQFFIPNLPTTRQLHCLHGQYVCRWLAEQAKEGLGVEAAPVSPPRKCCTTTMGGSRESPPVTWVSAPMVSTRTATCPAWVARQYCSPEAAGATGKIDRQVLAGRGQDPQHYGIGIKGNLEIPPEKHGGRSFTAQVALQESGTGGGVIIPRREQRVYVGLIADLNYSNPHMSPSRSSSAGSITPETVKYTQGGTRIVYGAGAITKGRPEFAAAYVFPAACSSAATPAPQQREDQGNHTAMKSGMLAAEAVVEALAQGETAAPADLASYTRKMGIVAEELYTTRNFPVSCTSSAFCWARRWSG